MPPPIALLDANVLIPVLIRDVFLTAAEQGLCRIHWSADILVEVERHLPDFIKVTGEDADAISRIKRQKAADAIALMTQAFPDALVTNYERHIPRMTNDAKDRHVAAAAWQAGADIVTFNLNHFKPTDLAPFRLHAIHPDHLLISLVRADAAGMATVIRAMVAKRKRPAITTTELLDGWGNGGLGGFATAMRAHLAPERE